MSADLLLCRQERELPRFLQENVAEEREPDPCLTDSLETLSEKCRTASAEDDTYGVRVIRSVHSAGSSGTVNGISSSILVEDDSYLGGAYTTPENCKHQSFCEEENTEGTSMYSCNIETNSVSISEMYTAKNVTESYTGDEDDSFMTCAQELILSSSILNGTISDLNVCIEEDFTGAKNNPNYPQSNESEKHDHGDVQFFPPLYVQRYSKVAFILQECDWKGQLRRVVDFGCSEFRFLHYLKNITEVREIALVDLDKSLLNSFSHRVSPLNSDFISRRENPLSVRVYCGNVSIRDQRFEGFDAVTAIELIEHLPEHELEKIPATIFGFMKPKMVVFTTPNAEFNVLFKNFSGFRHPDHKFEWTRKEFENWCSGIVEKYPDYLVTYKGVGVGPACCNIYGFCTQIAIFTWKMMSPVESEEKLPSSQEEEFKVWNQNQEAKDDHDDKIEIDTVVELSNDEKPYELLKECAFPYDDNPQTIEEKIKDQINYCVSSLVSDWLINGKDEDGQCLIPLSDLLAFRQLRNLCNDIEQLRQILIASGETIIEEKHAEDKAPNYLLVQNIPDNISTPTLSEKDEEEEDNAMEDTYYDNLVAWDSSNCQESVSQIEILKIPCESSSSNKMQMADYWDEIPETQNDAGAANFVEEEEEEEEELEEEEEGFQGMGHSMRHRHQIRVQSQVQSEPEIQSASRRGGAGEAREDDEDEWADMEDVEEDEDLGIAEGEDDEEEVAVMDLQGVGIAMDVQPAPLGWLEPEEDGEEENLPLDLGASGEPDAF